MKLLKNLNITRKLLIITLVSAAALCSVGFLGLNYIRVMAVDSEVMYKENLLPITDMLQIRINTRASSAYTLELLLTKDAAKNKELQEEIKSAWEEIDTLVAKIESGKMTAEEKALLDQFKEEVTPLTAGRDKVVNLAFANKNTEGYEIYLKEVETNRAKVNETLKELAAAKTKHAEKIYTKSKETLTTVTIFVAAVIILAVLLLLLLSYIIGRMIVKPVKEVKELLSMAEDGDFTVKGSYQSKDEIGELANSFNNMTAKLQSVFSTVYDSSQQVAAASEELSASAEENSKASEHITLTMQELTVGTDKQVDKIEDSADIISNITTYTKTIADNTDKITKDVLHASQVSAEGNEAITEVNKQMNSIYANVTSLSEAVRSLNERSNEIGEITNVITGISAQTNLLALNAAIEAARAGEHGKGFAVVADEVRTLAEESTKSTEQISNLIQLIQKDTEYTLQTMERASQEVNSGLTVVHTAGASFQKIETAVNGVVSQIEDISEALQKLANGTETVHTSIDEVSDVAKDSASITQNISAATQEQLASMEEITSSSQALALLADDLQAIIKQFKIG